MSQSVLGRYSDRPVSCDHTGNWPAVSQCNGIISGKPFTVAYLWVYTAYQQGYVSWEKIYDWERSNVSLPLWTFCLTPYALQPLC